MQILNNKKAKSKGGGEKNGPSTVSSFAPFNHNKLTSFTNTGKSSDTFAYFIPPLMRYFQLPNKRIKFTILELCKPSPQHHKITNNKKKNNTHKKMYHDWSRPPVVYSFRFQLVGWLVGWVDPMRAVVSTLLALCCIHEHKYIYFCQSRFKSRALHAPSMADAMLYKFQYGAHDRHTEQSIKLFSSRIHFITLYALLYILFVLYSFV